MVKKQPLWKTQMEYADATDCLEVIEQIIQAFPEVRPYIEGRIFNDPNAVQGQFETLKKNLAKHFLTKRTVKGKQKLKRKLKITPAKKMVTDFKKLEPKPLLMAQAYFWYCEYFTQYLDEFSIQPSWYRSLKFQAKYKSLVIAYNTLIEHATEHSIEDYVFSLIADSNRDCVFTGKARIDVALYMQESHEDLLKKHAITSL